MRIRDFGLSNMIIVVLALSLACFGGEEPEPTPEPTATPEPTGTATVTAVPVPTPPPPVPVMPPLPPSIQQGTRLNQTVVAQPVPTIAVRLITVESPTALPATQTDNETPTPTATSTPDADPDVQPTATPNPEPTATPISELSSTPTPIPEPTVTPTPEIAAESALAILRRALINLADSPGYSQEVTLTYRIMVAGDEVPRQRDVVLSFDYVRPDLMEGAIQIIGLTKEQEFTSVADSIYTPAGDGYHVPMTMPMRIGPPDVLACNILQCDSPDMARAPHIVQLTLDATETSVYDIAAAHGSLGYPHVKNDLQVPVDLTYYVSTRDETVREVQFANVELEKAHFSGFVDALIGLGIDDMESISMDLRLKLSELKPGRQIPTPQVRPEGGRRPEIVSADFRAGSAPQNPGPNNCDPLSCGSALIQFSRPVVAWGRVTLVVDGKGVLECVEGCSTEWASAYMLFAGDVWVEPGDEIFGSKISKADTTVIADVRGAELLTYSFDPNLRALAKNGRITASPPPATTYEPRFALVNRYPDEDVVFVRGFDLDPNAVYRVMLHESLGFKPGCPDELREFSFKYGDGVGDGLWEDPEQEAAAALRGYFAVCRPSENAGLLLLSVFDGDVVVSQFTLAGGGESVRGRPDGEPGIARIAIKGYELDADYAYEYELELPDDAPTTCTRGVRRKPINADNSTYTDFTDYLSHCLGVDAHFGNIRTTLWKRLGGGDWDVVATGRITP